MAGALQRWRWRPVRPTGRMSGIAPQDSEEIFVTAPQREIPVPAPRRTCRLVQPCDPPSENPSGLRPNQAPAILGRRRADHGAKLSAESTLVGIAARQSDMRDGHVFEQVE